MAKNKIVEATKAWMESSVEMGLTTPEKANQIIKEAEQVYGKNNS